jgi:phosphatidylinositol alpha-1,6-mannosyltransferase
LAGCDFEGAKREIDLRRRRDTSFEAYRNGAYFSRRCGYRNSGVSDAEIETVWARATALAMLSRVEGFGLVFVEAMRRGVPVLASIEDASPEVNLDGVTGFNVSRSGRSGIIDRIVCLMKDKEIASTLGSAGVERWRNNFRFSRFQERLDWLIHPWLAANQR